MSKTKMNVVEETPVSKPEEAPMSIAKPEEEFSLDRFKSKRGAAVANIAKLPSDLPVLKMAEVLDFVRLHPNEETYWSDELCFVSVRIQGQKHDTVHLIDEDIAMQFLPSKEIMRYRVALAAKPGDVFFLCKVPTRNVENSYNKTTLKACELAKTRWTKLTSRQDEGVEHYQISFAVDDTTFDKPNWPTQSLGELIFRTFTGRRVDRADHPVILRKIGAKQVLS